MAKRVAVIVGVVALAGYGALKAVWGMGGNMGVVDQAEFDRVFGSLTIGEVWLATWGTVMLAGCGVVLLIALAAGSATPLGRGRLGLVIRSLAWVVSVGLGVIAVVALAVTVIADGSSPFASWVSYLVYGSFLVYAMMLGQVLRLTRGRPTGTGAYPGR